MKKIIIRLILETYCSLSLSLYADIAYPFKGDYTVREICVCIITVDEVGRGFGGAAFVKQERIICFFWGNSYPVRGT